jgi:hypothetical protein
MTDFRVAPLVDESGASTAGGEANGSTGSTGSGAGSSPNASAGNETATSESSGGPNRAPAFVAAGVAVAGLAAGTIFGLQALSKKNDADNGHCTNKVCVDSDGSSLISQARTFATVSTIGFGVGIAGAAAATWLFVRPPGADSPRGSMVPVLGPRVAGLEVEGAW